MSGLLLKDILNMKKQGKIYLVIVALWVALGVFQGTMAYLTNMMPLLAIMLVINAMAYDEAAHWDRYALTMPVSRRDMVLSKYLLIVLSLLATMALATALAMSMGTPFIEALLASGAVCCIALCYMALILPVMFWLGVQKARVTMLVIIILPVALVSLGGSGDLAALAALPALAWLLPLATFALLAASALTSLRIYARKAF